jgi:hypothetical protein
MRQLVLALALAAVALFALTAPAYAGGWAIVTLDSLPREVHAGQTLHLGFMVRQHGHTPNSDVEPYLSATNQKTGESFQINARQQGPVGHFVVDVAFPRAGTWAWSITPAPFGATTFEPLTVLPAAGTDQAAADETALSPAHLLQPTIMRWAGLSMLLLGLALALFTKRAPVGRRVPRAQ